MCIQTDSQAETAHKQAETQAETACELAKAMQASLTKTS